jgi:hypothetical protein
MALKITTKPELAIEVVETRTLSEVELGFTREQINPAYQPGDARRYGATPGQPSWPVRLWRWLTRG